jgi:hypothetical protein
MSDVFDSLTWKDAVRSWWVAAEIETGHHVDLYVSASTDLASLSNAVRLADSAWTRLKNTESLVRASVAQQLTAAHNDYCDPADEVTEEQFAARIRLLSVEFQTDGGLDLCYHDSMLFGGHWLIVPVSADGTVGEAFEAG